MPWIIRFNEEFVAARKSQKLRRPTGKASRPMLDQNPEGLDVEESLQDGFIAEGIMKNGAYASLSETWRVMHASAL